MKKYKVIIEECGDATDSTRDGIFISIDKGLAFPLELFDFLQVLVDSANLGRYPENNWLKEGREAINSDSKSMCASMFRHLAEASSGRTEDKDSGLHPLLHLASRAMMLYVRQKRGLEL